MNKLYGQIQKWHQTRNTQDQSNDLMNLVVHLVLQSDEGGWDILKFLLDVASAEDPHILPQVSQTCGQLLGRLKKICSVQYTE